MSELFPIALIFGAAFAGLFLGAKVVSLVLGLGITNRTISAAILGLFAFSALCVALMRRSETALGGLGLFTLVGLCLGCWFCVAVLKRVFKK